MTKNFSKNYKTFSSWRAAHPGNSPYIRRISNAHSRYPRASLSQLRGHPAAKRKPISQLKPGKQRKRSPVRLVVVQGNVVNQEGTETAAQVYVEQYVRIADRNVDKFIGRTFKKLDESSLKIFRSDANTDRISVNLTGERKGNKIVSQKKAIKDIADKVVSEMHPARKTGFSHHKKGETRSGRHEEYKRRYEEE